MKGVVKCTVLHFLDKCSVGVGEMMSLFGVAQVFSIFVGIKSFCCLRLLSKLGEYYIMQCSASGHVWRHTCEGGSVFGTLGT